MFILFKKGYICFLYPTNKENIVNWTIWHSGFLQSSLSFEVTPQYALEYISIMDFNFFVVLKEIFPQALDGNIHEVITLVKENHSIENDDTKLQIMADMLHPSADRWDEWDPVMNPQPSTSTTELKNENYEILMRIFSDANPDYLWKFCSDQGDLFDIEDAIDVLSQDGYEKIEKDPLTIWEQLQNMLPDADPLYLKKEAVRLVNCSPLDMNVFLTNAIDNGGYPTMQDYLKNKKEYKELAIYKHIFDVNKFLEVIPDPVTYFSNPQRSLALNSDSNETDIKYALAFLHNKYRFIRKKYIYLLFGCLHKNLITICERLDKMRKCMRRPRPLEEPDDTNNLALLQEITYLKHRKQIIRTLKLKDEHYRLAKEEAIEFNLLEVCKCCYAEELIPEECYFCLEGCVFCKECVRTGTETIIGKGDTRFPCFSSCNSEFSLRTLRMVLPENTFERLVRKIAVEEIQKMDMEGLESCPFCPFMMILPINERLFKCKNPECSIESCRECKHKSHVPLRCSEIEYDEDVRRRTYIEDKMTEALTRTCYSCKKVYIKANGCNKMTCVCGAMMCYLCLSPVQAYNHFGEGRCPLFSDDATVNLQRVIAGAENAKRELGDVQIKNDPSANIETFFK